MFGRPTVICALAALQVAVASLAARGADDVLKQVPKSAWAVVVVNRLDATSTLSEKLGGQLQLPVFNPLGIVKVLAHIEGGLDDKGSAAIAWLPDPAGGPMPVAIGYLPITNYDTFIQHLVVGDAQAGISTVNLAGQQLLCARKGQYAVLAQPGSEALITATLEAKDDATAAFAPLGTWVTGNEIIALATTDGIRSATDAMAQGLTQAKEQMANAGQAAPAAIEWFETLESVLGNVRTQVTLAGVGIDVSTDGHLTTSIRATFDKSGSWAQAAAVEKPATTPPLGGLAATPFALALGSSDLSLWTEKKLDFGMDMLRTSLQNSATPLTDAQLKSLRDVTLKIAQQSRTYAMQIGVATADEGLLMKTLGIIGVDDSTTYMADLNNYLAVYAKIASEVNSPSLPQYTTANVPIGNKTGMAMTMDLAKVLEGVEAQGAPEATAIADRVLRMLLGPSGKLTAYAVAIDSRRVVIGYDKAAVEAFVSAPPTPGNQLADDDLVQKSLMLLPAGSQTVGLISPTGLVTIANQVLGKAPRAQGFQLPGLKSVPPLGIGSMLSPTGYELRIVAPAEALSGIGSLIAALRQGPPRAQQPGRAE